MASSVGSRRVYANMLISSDRLYICGKTHTCTTPKNKQNKVSILKKKQRAGGRYVTRAYCLNRVKLEEEFRKPISVGGLGGRSERGGARI